MNGINIVQDQNEEKKRWRDNTVNNFKVNKIENWAEHIWKRKIGENNLVDEAKIFSEIEL